ncbi:MAG: shikimate dehydrogenase [Clostridium sp.]|nr:shikimate dehydrogenase [Clostridium sp.]
MEFLGVLGEKLPHTYSPIINKRIMELINVEGAYKKFELPRGNMQKFIDGVKILNIRGFNITIPYKEEVMPFLDYISNEAKNIGAVNTVVNKNGKLYGYNTDYFGFYGTLKIANIDVKDKITVILGSGGASKAIREVLLDCGAKKVYIVSRNPKESSEKSKNERVKLISYDELAKLSGYLLVNSTPVGMYPKTLVSPVGEEVIEKYKAVDDIVYNPTETEILKKARSLGKISIGGLYMLVGQAVKAEEIFHDTEIDKEVIDIIYNELKKEF